MHLADKIPAVAFVVLGIVSIAAIAITAGMIWAQTANLLVFGAVATVLSLIGLCVWLSIVLSRHDLARLEALTRHREAEFLPRPTDATAARLAAPPKRLEVHHGNLPAKQNPFRDWR
jgi:L-asparagine transporter-like permease